MRERISVNLWKERVKKCKSERGFVGRDRKM